MSSSDVFAELRQKLMAAKFASASSADVLDALQELSSTIEHMDAQLTSGGISVEQYPALVRQALKAAVKLQEKKRFELLGQCAAFREVLTSLSLKDVSAGADPSGSRVSEDAPE